jgi:uncharacterized protein YutE (UPF0331/DUF86 family)
MTVPPDRAEIIVEKAEFIELCLEVLGDRQSVGPEEYADSLETKDVVERRFEKMTQACIDIARMLLSDLGRDVPAANPDTMRELAAAGVLSESVAEEMAQACGFRNVLAHEYGEVIDDGMVYEALQNLARYRDFLVGVRDFLSDEGVI